MHRISPRCLVRRFHSDGPGATWRVSEIPWLCTAHGVSPTQVGAERDRDPHATARQIVASVTAREAAVRLIWRSIDASAWTSAEATCNTRWGFRWSNVGD